MPILLIILQLAPLLIAIIQAVEQAISAHGKGKEKLAVVKVITEKALLADPNVPDAIIPEVMVVAESITNEIVAALNESGTFTTIKKGC